jgi:hypothetical protein
VQNCLPNILCMPSHPLSHREHDAQAEGRDRRTASISGLYHASRGNRDRMPPNVQAGTSPQTRNSPSGLTTICSRPAGQPCHGIPFRIGWK